MDKMKYDEVQPDLITLEIAYDEIFLHLHHDKTSNQAIEDSFTENNQVCFALTPENAISVGIGLIEAAYHSKVKREAIAKGNIYVNS